MAKGLLKQTHGGPESSGEDLGDATPSRWRKPNVCERPVDPRRTARAPSCGQDLPERSYTPPDPQGRKISWSHVSPPPPPSPDSRRHEKPTGLPDPSDLPPSLFLRVTLQSPCRKPSTPFGHRSGKTCVPGLPQCWGAAGESPLTLCCFCGGRAFLYAAFPSARLFKTPQSDFHH